MTIRIGLLRHLAKVAPGRSVNFSQVLAVYREKADRARLVAAQRISEAVAQRVALREFSIRSLEIASEWRIADNGVDFDWSQIRDTYRSDPKRLEMAIWSNERLCGMGIGLLSSASLELRFLEGCPDPNCPLIGRRLLTALECATNYAQATGRRQIRLQPINERLTELYEGVYGFTRDTPSKGKPFYKKEV